MALNSLFCADVPLSNYSLTIGCFPTSIFLDFVLPVWEPLLQIISQANCKLTVKWVLKCSHSGVTALV